MEPDPGLILRKCDKTAKVRSSLRWSLYCESDESELGSAGGACADQNFRRPPNGGRLTPIPLQSIAEEHGIRLHFDGNFVPNRMI